MHKRTKECSDEPERWETGSGKLEFNLSLEENVLQEILEEYCCQGEIEERLPAHDIFRDQDGVRTHWIAIPFFVKVDPKQVKIGEPHKMSEIGWFPIDKLPQPLHTGFIYTFNKFGDLFKKYLSVN